MEIKNPQLPYWMAVALAKYWSEKAKSSSCEIFIFEYIQKMIVNNRGMHYDFIDYLNLKSKTEIDTLYLFLNTSNN